MESAFKSRSRSACPDWACTSVQATNIWFLWSTCSSTNNYSIWGC